MQCTGPPGDIRFRDAAAGNHFRRRVNTSPVCNNYKERPGERRFMPAQAVSGPRQFLSRFEPGWRAFAFLSFQTIFWVAAPAARTARIVVSTIRLNPDIEMRPNISRTAQGALLGAIGSVSRQQEDVMPNKNIDCMQSNRRSSFVCMPVVR